MCHFLCSTQKSQQCDFYTWQGGGGENQSLLTRVIGHFSKIICWSWAVWSHYLSRLQTCNGSKESLKWHWKDWHHSPLPAISRINNYTITFNFPGGMSTISSRHISNRLLPLWLLYPISSLCLSSSSLSAAAKCRSFIFPPRFIFPLSFCNSSVFRSPVSCLCRTVCLPLSSSCGMVVSCDAIYPTYCVAIAPPDACPSVGKHSSVWLECPSIRNTVNGFFHMYRCECTCV